MAKFLAGVLSVIAVGVLLIAYGLLSPRVGAYGAAPEFSQFARPLPAGDSILLRDDPYARYGYPAGSAAPAPYGYYNHPAPPAAAVTEARPVRTVSTAPAPRRVVRADEPRRNWKKTAAVIGGSTAGAAGIGAIFGGKKGALIGAAIGGGASTIYEATK
jgi:hypothetical protein